MPVEEKLSPTKIKANQRMSELAISMPLRVNTKYFQFKEISIEIVYSSI